MDLHRRLIARKKGGAAMKVYISIPITGYSYKERREKAAAVYMNLLEKGFEPVNPMNNGFGEHDSRAEHMKTDFLLLLNCDAIYLCRGWRKSQGCLAEKTVAEQCGMIVMEGGAE